MTTKDEQIDHVRDYFDYDSVKYFPQRYGSDPKTCEQYSYTVRRGHVLRMLDGISGKRGAILDIGCGPGIYTRDLLLRGWEVWGMDISPKMLEVAQHSITDVPESSRAHFSIGQIERLSFETSFFDAVICIGVIPYVVSLEKAVSEAVRVVKAGGHVLFQLSNKLAPIRIESSLKELVKSRLGLKRHGDEEDRLRDQLRIAHHNPFRFNRLCGEYGLRLRDFRFYDFRVPVLTSLSPGIALTVGRRLETLGGSKYAGSIGAGYLVMFEKESTL